MMPVVELEDSRWPPDRGRSRENRREAAPAAGGGSRAAAVLYTHRPGT